ncbi:MAG: flagellar M-ring protein FliF [Verrucomicrobia bacterium]|nr:flagellar M-ring protein FliF [Verrucomicrobiota bacterium]
MNLNIAQLGRQLLAIWKQLGLNQRLSVVLTGLAVVVGLAGLAFFSSRVDYALLYGNLDDASAGKVIAALDNAKVPYKLKGARSVFVPADKVDQMRIQLAPEVKHGDVGFEIFDKNNFGISDFAQRVNFLRATKGELERTISHIDDVESARVTLYVPENRLLVDSRRQPTAAVLVKLKGNAQLTPETVKTIRYLVASAVEGLQATQISVADTHGNNFAEPTDNDSLTGTSNNQLALRQKTEQLFAKKAEGMLDQVLGPGQSVVRVAVELDTETQTTAKEEYGEGVPRTKTKKTDTNNSTTGSPGTATGASTNTGADTNNAAATPTTVSQQNTTTETTEFDVAKTTSNLVKGVGGLKRISAAVVIAARLEGAGKERKVVPRTPEEVEKLRRIVQSALGIQTNTERKDEITLEEIPFNDQFATELTQKMEKQEKKDFWMELVRQMIFPALALAVLAAFWRAFKRTPAENIPIGIPIGTLAVDVAANGNGSGNGHGVPDWRKPQPPGVVTVEVLNQLVRDNPGNMTQAIRSWLTRGNNKN